MGKYHLAVDLGASGGRHLLGWLEGGKYKVLEVHRFENHFSQREEGLCWDVAYLFEQILVGMKKCVTLDKIPATMGIDTWGVDFVLLDANDEPTGPAVSYRDDRTAGMDRKVEEYISEDELYRETGIQKQVFNTIYQLKALQEKTGQLEQAKSLLLLPDYFHFLLTGVKMTEYTNATTTGLLDPSTKDWNWELIERLEYPRGLFLPVVQPGTRLGSLRCEISKSVGFDCEVVLPCTHDTASAVLAVPSQSEDILYISSGTWSLLGTERGQSDCGRKSREANFTNEGGYGGRYRYLRNIMGLWMIQSLRREWGNAWTFAQLAEMAYQESTTSLVDCNDPCFLAPTSMEQAIRDYCRNSGQPEPVSPAQFVQVVYRSLAVCYARAIERLEAHTGIVYPGIYIVGGGSRVAYLNKLTAKATGKPVYAGPAEATAIGNLAAQMLATGEMADVQAARRCIFSSFSVEIYEKDGI